MWVARQFGATPKNRGFERLQIVGVEPGPDILRESIEGAAIHAGDEIAPDLHDDRWCAALRGDDLRPRVLGIETVRAVRHPEHLAQPAGE